MENPFLLSGYRSAEYFCDRVEETENTINALMNRRNITLFSVRRMGKTGLIRHIIEQLEEQQVHCFMFDIYATTNTQELIDLLGSGILGKADSLPRRIADKVKEFILSFRPRITYDQLSGAPAVEFYLQAEQPELTLTQILSYLESHETKVIIAIDEFQQINNYPETNLEAILRTHIQKLNNINFIFSGSETDMLVSMFNDAKRPFYQSTQMLHLKPIENVHYSEFITRWMERGGKSISEEALNQLLKLTRTHTYYVQMLCNKLFSTELSEIGIQEVNDMLVTILKENEYVYFNYRHILSKMQWNLLKAIAKDGDVQSFNSKDFLTRHKLGAASSVNRALEALDAKDMVSQFFDENGQYYRINDVFLEKWLARL